MMELVERAIPVIQHPPEAGATKEPVRAEPPVAAAAGAATEVGSAIEPPPSRRDDELAVEITTALAHVHQTLERLRTQQAQLTSGAILQQYQRQVTFQAEDSRPATKVLSIQG